MRLFKQIPEIIAPETLALFRIALAIIVITDVLLRATDLSYFYADSGVLPRELLIKSMLNVDRISVHLASGSVHWQAFLSFVQLCFGGALLVGWHTKLASIGTWFLLLSIQNRNPLAIHGGDDILRLLCFWSMFLPLNGVWSLDARLTPKTMPSKPSFAHHLLGSLGGVAIKIQIVSIYWCIVAARNHPEWLSEGSAVYFALQLDQFLTPFGLLLRNFLDQHLAWYPYLTWSVMLLEAVGPFFLLAPGRVLPLIGILLLAGMHLSFGASMYLGVFPWIDVISLVVFLPRDYAAWVLTKLGGWGRQLHKLLPWPREPWLGHLSQRLPVAEASPLGNCLARVGIYSSLGLLLASLWYVLSLNFCQLNYFACHFPVVAQRFGQTLYLQQHWSMFSPYPLKDDGYYAMPGKLRNGESVDVYLALDSGAKELKPAVLSHIYRGDRHRKYMMNLWAKRHQEARLPYGRYLCRKWNENVKDRPQLELENFEIVFYLEKPKFGAAPEVERVVIWKHTCF